MKRGHPLEILKEKGCVFVKHGGKHDQYLQPKTGKLLSDVIRILLDKSGVDRDKAKNLASFIEKANGKEYDGMFEAVIESIIEEREEAREDGARKEKLRNAANFKQLGVSPEIISQATGLSIEEIERI